MAGLRTAGVAVSKRTWNLFRGCSQSLVPYLGRWFVTRSEKQLSPLDWARMQILSIRTFMKTSDRSIATEIAEALISAIGPLAEMEKTEIKPYWKIEDYMEVFLVFQVNGDLLNVLNVSKSLLGRDWEALNAYEAIWVNRKQEVTLIPELRWAHIEVYNKG